MEQVTYSKARKSLGTLIDKVSRGEATIKITRSDGLSVVMVPLEEWNAIAATLHLLGSPKNAERLSRSIQQLDAGRST